MQTSNLGAYHSGVNNIFFSSKQVHLGNKPLPKNWYWPRSTWSVMTYGLTGIQWVNTLRPRQNGRHFADAIFKCIFLNENAWISLEISLKFVLKVRINNIPTLVQIMAWRRPGDKPSSEPVMVSLLTHICITRPQWVNLCWLYGVDSKQMTSNGSWCIGIKGEMSGTVCVTFTWDIYIYIWVVYSFCLFCCLFIIVTWWYIWCIVWQVASKRKYRHVW